jgi:proton glutamate symport protein
MKRISLTGWIFIGMAVGIAVGLTWPDIGKQLQIFANIFLRLIKSIVAPLLFGTLVYGIAGTGDIKAMGRIGLKAIVYFEIVTTVALFLGLGVVNLAKPGVGLHAPAPATAAAAQTGAPAAPAATPSLTGILEHTFPSSIIDAMAKNEVLQVVVFCFMFGAACAAIGEKARPVVEFAESLAEVMFRYTRYVMYLAPLGVAGAMAATVSQNGPAVLVQLGKLVLTTYGAQVLFVICVLLPVAMIARVPVKRFFNAAKEPFVIAFSTASSESALPLALENMEKFGAPKHIVAFVLPTGYSFNLDGTTLYLAMASIFIAQVAGVHLTFGQQIVMMLTLMLTSKGVAGVPRASFVILTGTLAAFNLPVEAASIILGVDALLDMARTSVNVLGNCLATAVIAKWEGVRIPEGDHLDSGELSAAAAD